MKAIWLYRIAAVLLVLFAVGHTVGFVTFRPQSAEGQAVWEGMQGVSFQVEGTSSTYGRFYMGFGLFQTVYLLFLAFVAWCLGALARSNPAAIRPLAWGFFALQIASLVLSWLYFLPPPVVFSALVAICAGWAAWLLHRTKAAVRSAAAGDTT